MSPSIVDRPQTPFPILTDFTGRTREQRLGSSATVKRFSPSAEAPTARVEFLFDDWLWLIDPAGKRIVDVAAGASSVLCCWW